MSYEINSDARHETEWLEVLDEQGRINRLAPRNYRSPRTLELRCLHLREEIRTPSGELVRVKCDCGGQAIMLQAHACEKFERCLPHTAFSAQRLARWYEREESTLYKLCQTCELNPNRKD